MELRLPPTTNANSCLNSDIWQKNCSLREYGSHTPSYTENLRDQICIFCYQRRPVSLEELTFSVILETAGLIQGVYSSLYHLPHRICWLIGRLLNADLIAQAWRLVPLVAEYGDRRPSWFDVEQDKTTWLWRFLFACDVHEKLKSYSICSSAGLRKVLQYNSSAKSTYEDFWESMLGAVRTVEEETKYGWFKSLTSATPQVNVVPVPPELTDFNRLTSREMSSMKALQKLSRTFATPIVFRPTEISLLNLKSNDISSLLDYFDPQVIFSVDLRRKTWSVKDLDELGRVLSICRNLTDIYLRQVTPSLDGEIEDVAPTLSRLFSHHPQLEMLGLKGFQLAGTLASCRLPPVKNLRLRQCTFSEEDWKFMANRSDLTFKKLSVSSYLWNAQFPSLCSFMFNQAPTIESLGFEFPTLTVEEICRILRVMAKFNKLRVLDLACMEEMHFASVEKIIFDFMSIHSTRTFFISFLSIANEGDRNADVSRLNKVIERSCRANRRPPIRVIMDTW